MLEILGIFVLVILQEIVLASMSKVLIQSGGPPLRKGVIPTLTIVDGTLENAPEKVEQIIADAKQYAEKYL